MSKFITIAIDGPGAAGKSSVAKEIARRLNYTYIDTGAMYRCLALYALNNNISVDDEEALCEAVDHLDIQLSNTGKVILNGEDVSLAIRSSAVTNNVSPVSSPRSVREKFVKLQQKLAKQQNGVVMDGRDIGTVVLPDADLKIFQIASPEVRAKRRYDENLTKGIHTPLKDLEEEIKRRDYLDENKSFGALKKAHDAIELDTSYMSFEEVVEHILNLAKDLIKWEKRLLP